MPERAEAASRSGITGAAAGFYNAILTEMVGVRPGYRGLEIAPRLGDQRDEILVGAFGRVLEYPPEVGVQRPVEAQLAGAGLNLSVDVISDRHMVIHGTR